MPIAECNKIKAGQTVTLSFRGENILGENNYLNKLSGARFLVDKITVNKDNCVLRLVRNSDVIEKTILNNSALLNRVESCELVLDGTIFEKIFGSLF